MPLPKYVTRLLPVEEWYKLKGTEAELVYPNFNEEHTNIMVVERDNVIVGSWCLFPVYHAECVWIKPEHRGNPVVAGRLIQGMKRMAFSLDIKNIITSAVTKEIEELLIKHLHATKIPGTSFVFPVTIDLTDRG